MFQETGGTIFGQTVILRRVSRHIPVSLLIIQSRMNPMILAQTQIQAVIPKQNQSTLPIAPISMIRIRFLSIYSFSIDMRNVAGGDGRRSRFDEFVVTSRKQPIPKTMVGVRVEVALEKEDIRVADPTTQIGGTCHHVT